MSIETVIEIALAFSIVALVIILARTAIETVREHIEHGKGEAWEAGYAAGHDRGFLAGHIHGAISMLDESDDDATWASALDHPRESDGRFIA